MALNQNLGNLTEIIWSSGTTFSGSHDAGTAARRRAFAVVRVFNEDTGTVTATCTYNGVSMVEEITAAEVYAGGGRIIRIYIFSLNNPASGTNTFEVTVSSSAITGASAFIWTPSDCGGIGTGTKPTDNGNLSSFSLGITTDESTSIILAAYGGVSARDVTEGTGVSLLHEVTGTTNWAGTKAASGGADTIAWTLFSANRCAGCALEMLEDLGAGETQPAERLTLMGVT